MNQEETKREEQENKKNSRLVFFPLSSISSDVFSRKAPFRGVYINTMYSDLEIENNFAKNPLEKNTKLRFLVDTDAMKQKIQRLIIGEERVTVETWYDLTQRVEALEKTTIKTIADMNKSTFWNESEMKIPSDKKIRFLTPFSSNNVRADGIIGYDESYGMVSMTVPAILTARITDFNYQPDIKFEHYIENEYMRPSIRYRYIDRTKSPVEVGDIWSYTPKTKTEAVTLNYPIGDNALFSNVYVDQNIYLRSPDSKIKKKKTTGNKI